MAAFTTFGNTLPNPDVKINYAGQETATGNEGPGYASVKIEAEYQTTIDKTNSGRLVSRANAAQSWKIDITYNPMTRAEFSPVYSFLLEKQGRLRPFFVTLPQHSTSQNTSFNSVLTLSNTVSPGATYFLLNGYNSAYGTPVPGDLFTITDASNSNHTKAYKVTRVETNADYNSNIGQPSTTQLRIHFTPPLQKTTYINATLVFTDPKIKVIMTSDVLSYQLKTDNLYVFSLNLEEIQ